MSDSGDTPAANSAPAHAPMSAQAFIGKWDQGGTHAQENERQGAQAFFLDLCDLLGVPKPGDQVAYVFEKQTLALGQERGYADVFWRNRFAWENKAPGKNLDSALRQLLGYSLALASPPLLVVSDRFTTRIHTQFNGHPSETYTVETKHLDQADKQHLLRRVWLDPESFRPQQTNRDITERAAHSFAKLADSLRKRGPQQEAAKAQHAEDVAHFLTQTLFCFFAEDVGLLPGRMFEQILTNRRFTALQLTQTLQKLLDTMREGGPFGADFVPWFNGGLFKSVSVPELSILEITELRNAAQLNWSAIDVSIFGTLFERGLDPAKRSQLGAHYTDPATIERIIEPVVRRPLLQKWEQEKQHLSRLLAQNTKKAVKDAAARYSAFLNSLCDFKVLDPACGSGNFLYLGLKALKDVEHRIITEADGMGLQRPLDLCTSPANMLGIEVSEYAAELARVTVWIGELQWRLKHGYPFKENPILEPLDCIEHRDAILAWEGEGDALKPVEAAWPKVSVVIGNPPFLGDRKMIRELGETYTFALRKAYDGKVPGGADLVCYWFERARHAIETQGLGAAGLVATNSIRGGANRKVLDAICATTKIYEAWSDSDWVNDGAAVRVSIIAFGHADQTPTLDGQAAQVITADLRGTQSISEVARLQTNRDTSYIGTQKNGPFDVSHEQAIQWLRLPNPHGKSNALVVRPWANGLEVTRRPQHRWVVDFGCDLPLNEAMLFEAPFSYVKQHVEPTRRHVRRDFHREHWWLYGDARPGLRADLVNIHRFVVTPMVAKHRVFTWMPSIQIPENLCVAITRADDTTFGILHSRFHELWSLRMCTWLGVGNDPRYTPTTCFETFPFPAGLTPQDTAHQRTEVIEGGALIPAGLPGAALKAHASSIASAARRLYSLREAWLNPPEWTQVASEVVPLGMASSPYPPRILPKDNLPEHALKELAKRTLTALYNQRPMWLATAHEQLDMAVAAAYGWSDYTPAMSDEEILQRLLALNVARASS